MGVMNAIKNFNRLKQIVNLLFKEELGFIISKLKLKSHLTIEKQFQKTEFEKTPASIPVRLRHVMEDAGGGLIKLGQLLSLRTDLLPKEYCDEFSKLQDGVKPFQFSQVKQIIELELNNPINKIFKSFDEKPIAAASVGQVHKAVLKTGEVVAVKIQRPGISQVFETDINILYYLAELSNKHIPEIKSFNLPKIVKVFEEYTKKELDYIQEGKNIELFYQKNRNNPNVVIPRVYWDHTTSKVLVMSFVEGKSIKQVQLSKEQRARIGSIISNSLIKQVLEYHIFHADPHPGNVFLTPDKKIAFLDFGIVGRVSPDMSEEFEDMLIGLVKGDLNLLARSFIDLGIVSEEIDEKQFREDLFQKWGAYHGSNLNKINMKEFFEDTFELARKYKMEFPTNFVLLLKSLATAEGLYRTIYPESNFVRVCTPKVEQIMNERKSLKNIARELKKSTWSFTRSVKRFPEDLRSLVHLIKKGANVNVDINNKDVGELTREISTSSSRLTFGFIIGGLIVAFALIVLAGVEPKMYGIPFIALPLIFIIIVMSLLLGISILWDKKRGEYQ